jgi:hypothetical protein
LVVVVAVFPVGVDIFDEEVRKMITPFLQGGLLTLSVVSEVVWGIPKVLPPVPVHS